MGGAVVLALVGRRIDAPEAATPAFPGANVERVRADLLQLLNDQSVNVLVCSAACGADLLALEAAETLGIRRQIILPFEVGRFRAGSVVDRPGNWGPIFDRIVAAAANDGGLAVLSLESSEDDSYVQTNHTILEVAIGLASSTGDRPAAAVVWDGVPRENGDFTDSFRKVAMARGLEVFEISTR
jgi:hypothetical protein